MKKHYHKIDLDRSNDKTILILRIFFKIIHHQSPYTTFNLILGYNSENSIITFSQLIHGFRSVYNTTVPLADLFSLIKSDISVKILLSYAMERYP